MVKEKKLNSVKEPLVSVIMNCYNGEKFLRQAIESVYSQTYKNWEIIFWDNCSEDKSAEIAQSYDSKLIYQKGGQKMPLGAARNNALKVARGEFIAFLDVDDYWSEEKLQIQIPLFKSRKVGLVYSNSVTFHPRGRKVIQFKKNEDMPRGDVSLRIIEKYFLNLQTVVVRKSVLFGMPEQFDESMHVSEEADLFIRIAQDHDFECTTEVLAYYRVHENNSSWTNTERFLVENTAIINKLKISYKNKHDYDKASVFLLNKGHWNCGFYYLLNKNKKKALSSFKNIKGMRLKKALFILAIFILPKEILCYVIKYRFF